MIVAKFGGTSVKDSEAMLRSARIAYKYPNVKVVVVSATAGTTNKLMNLCSEPHLKKDLLEIIKHHETIAVELDLDNEGLKKLGELLGELTSFVETHSDGLNQLEKDYILSFGERISSLLFTYAMKKVYGEKTKVTLFDVRNLLVTNNSFGDAIPLISQSKKNLNEIKKHLNPNEVIVTQGFIGKTEDGKTTTIGRGGSDFSAALLAMLCEASELHIWTDVAGVFTIDPRINKNAKAVPTLTYLEAAELANLGAKILHPLTLTPCIEQKIPIFVGNSFNPDQEGTWVRENTNQDLCFVKAISFRPKQTLLTFSKIKKLKQFGFLSEIFTILAKNQISVDHVTTSEISTSITLQDDDKLSDKNILQELEQLAPISIERNFGLISLIGDHIIHRPHIQKSLFETLDGHEIRSIFMGASQNNISFLVNKVEADDILRKLHLKFFGV